MKNIVVHQRIKGFLSSHHFLFPVLGLLTGHFIFLFIKPANNWELSTGLWMLGILLIGLFLWIIKSVRPWAISTIHGGRWVLIYGIHVYIGNSLCPPSTPAMAVLKGQQYVLLDCVDSVAKTGRVNGEHWVKISRGSRSMPWIGPLEKIYLPVQNLSPFSQSGIPGDVDWPRVYGSQGLASRAVWPQVVVGIEGNFHAQASLFSWNTLLDWRLRCLRWVRNSLNRFLGPEEAALACALLVGESREVSEDVVRAFGVGGLMHVLAVSGMHISLVMGALLWLLTGLGTRRNPPLWALGVLILVGWFYVVITGGSAAVVRAMLSASWLWIGKFMLQRSVSALHVWLGCAYLQLLWQPYSIYNLGFVLSYVAVLSLLLLYPLLVKEGFARTEDRLLSSAWWLRRIGKSRMILYWRAVLGAVSMNLSATLFTFPVVLHSFGSFPVWFLPVNLVLVPLFTVLLYGAIGVLALGWIPVLGDAIAWGVQGLFSGTISVLLKVLDMPCSQLFSVDWDGISVGLFYLMLGLMLVWLWLRIEFQLSRSMWLWAIFWVFLCWGIRMEWGIQQRKIQDDYFSGVVANHYYWAYRRNSELVVVVQGKEVSAAADGKLRDWKHWNADSTIRYRRIWEGKIYPRLEKYCRRHSVKRVCFRW